MNQYPNVAIVGPSGSGKSSSLRNLKPEETGLINVERKALPFKGAGKFAANEAEVKSINEYYDAIKKFSDDPKIKQIIIDSFTSLDELILAYCRSTYKGYDIYSTHNNLIRQIIDRTKLKDKVCVLIGIDEIVPIDLPTGGKVAKRFMKVEGRELQGTIEKEFTVVFFTEVSKAKSGDSMDYKFMTNTDGINTAKSPMGMFAGKLIDNDLASIIATINEYYK